MRPAHLREIYDLLYNAFGPQDWWPADTAFEVMVGAVLTQNTSWANVEKAISNLKKRRLISPRRLNRLSVAAIASLIKPAGYFNVKAKRLKNLIEFLFEEYNGNLAAMRHQKVPLVRQKLLAVNGIGPETADSILLYALNRPIFVIDAYTKRIFSRCGIVDEDISYDELQRLFMEGLPRSIKLYNEYHALIVRLGKDVCRKRPLCNLCGLAGLCKK